MNRSSENYDGVDNLEVMAQAVNYNRYLLGLIKQYITSKADSQSLIMDFGTGVGTFSRPIIEEGYNVICVEPDNSMRKALAEDGIQCLSDINEADDNSINHIYTFNVLEHIEDDAGAVKELYRALAPGGALLVYVPAYQVLYSSMDEKVGHYRRYRKKHLTNIICEAGFDIDKSEYVDSLGFFAALLYKWIGNQDGEINVKSIVLFDTVVFPVSRMIDLFLNKLLGKNVLVIAHKPPR